MAALISAAMQIKSSISPRARKCGNGGRRRIKTSWRMAALRVNLISCPERGPASTANRENGTSDLQTTRQWRHRETVFGRMLVFGSSRYENVLNYAYKEGMQVKVKWEEKEALIAPVMIMPVACAAAIN